MGEIEYGVARRGDVWEDKGQKPPPDPQPFKYGPSTPEPAQEPAPPPAPPAETDAGE